MSHLIIYTLIVLLFSAFFSGMEIAFVSSSKLRHELDKASNSLSSKIVGIFYKHPNNFISTLLVGNNIALVIYGILMAQLLQVWFLDSLDLNEGLELLFNTIISTLIVLVTGEFLPKTIFKHNPNGMLSFFALPMFLIYIVLFPISKFTSSLSKLMLLVCGVKVGQNENEATFTRVDLDHLIQSNIEEVKNEDNISEEVKIFQNALDFSSVKVRDCIVPRTEVTAVDINTPLETLKSQFVESGHSKSIV